jgi:hypothetical protein
MAQSDLPRPSIAEMLQHAADCENAATQTTDSELRETRLYLAKQWRALAADTEKMQTKNEGWASSGENPIPALLRPLLSR